MEAQLLDIFERIFRPHQGALWHIQPVDEAGEREAQGGTARQNGQSGEFVRRQRPQLLISIDECGALGDVERTVGFETPGIEAYDEVVGVEISAGEIKVDETRYVLAEEQNIVGEEIGMDDAARQIVRPDR